MITIIDCGSQLTQNIARRIRELGVFTNIVPYHTNPSALAQKDLEGIIISGGQFSVYDTNAPLYNTQILHCTTVPILGICYGQQSIAHLLGGKVRPASNREYGATYIQLKHDSPLFNSTPKEFRVWMSHGDIVEKLPEGFQALAHSQNGHVAAMQKGKIYAVQFHPEVDHTQHGRKILDNFLTLCNATKTWDPEKDYDRIVTATREQITEKVGVGGVSGGVDSTTASVIVGNIAGNNYHPIFVDNGLLRLHEPARVKATLSALGLNVHYVDAADRFLAKLKGVTSPDEKRKITGNEFIAVFEEEARKIPNASYLVQGTLYPDVIESVPVYGISSKIKRHHNVGGLPEHMHLEVVEPFRNLFKDEVRKIAEHRLNLPREIVWRHPFPGPGLAVRIIGDVTPQKLHILREADAIFIEELQKRNLYDQISQAFAVLPGTQAVGVMGDEGTYQHAIGLRAVVTDDFMTANWFRFPYEDLEAICNRIINEVKGVNRTFYDTTQKPPGTIEWE